MKRSWRKETLRPEEEKRGRLKEGKRRGGGREKKSGRKGRGKSRGFGQDGGGQGGQIKRVIFMGTQAAIINVTDETASWELCKLLHLGLRDNRVPRKTYGYSRLFFISLAAVTISSRAAHRQRTPWPRRRKERWKWKETEYSFLRRAAK